MKPTIANAVTYGLFAICWVEMVFALSYLPALLWAAPLMLLVVATIMFWRMPQ